MPKKEKDTCKVTFLDGDSITEGKCNTEALHFATLNKQMIFDLTSIEFLLNPKTKQYDILNEEFHPLSDEDTERIISRMEKYTEEYNRFVDIINRIPPSPSWTYLVAKEKMENLESYLLDSQDTLIAKLAYPTEKSASDSIEDLNQAETIIKELPELFGQVKLQAEVGHVEKLPGLTKLKELIEKQKKEKE